MTPRGELYVKVRLLSEPALWCWEIHDRRSGRVVMSSWEASWDAYGSRAEAVSAGAEHLRRYLRSDAPIDDAPTTPPTESRLARAS